MLIIIGMDSIVTEKTTKNNEYEEYLCLLYKIIGKYCLYICNFAHKFKKHYKWK